ncbi:GNAT family N-acetyltransferase [Vitiosangium sp. GDMCC 1.1324]|uniref:GNAT family N-acetyltransferase n=1 Tax=Vitiosangium sp. (strain GDMCC 1.1324) TaxID=2138576 RepID=UPI000D38B352|nr:GNAT family N-acetyltransferase [Vitiosangium sp. GDMCC 1.1324]PTL77804.1 cellulose biosynthesis protein CelD [Vitiosangium sp. GDMCC 1.1324]
MNGNAWMQREETGRTLPGACRWRVDIVRETQGFQVLRDEWRSLSEAGRARVFNTWEWLFGWHLHLGRQRRLFLLTVRDEAGVLAGVLPLSIEEQRWGGGRLRWLRFLGDDGVGSDYLDAILRPGDEAGIMGALAEALAATWREWDVLELSDMEEASPSVALLGAHCQSRGWNLESTGRNRCPYETFESGESFDTFLSRVARADNFLRRRRWLERQKGFALTKAEKPEELARALPEFFRLHALRWGGRSALDAPDVQTFHQAVVPLLAEAGRVRLYLLSVEGRAVASVYALLHGRTFSYYNAGYDPEWKARSVGLVLVGETFRDALAEGFSEYDFLRGVEAYKSDWTRRVRTTVRLRITRPASLGDWAVRAQALERAARGMLRDALPEEWLARLRRLKQWRRQGPLPTSAEGA